MFYIIELKENEYLNFKMDSDVKPYEATTSNLKEANRFDTLKAALIVASKLKTNFDVNVKIRKAIEVVEIL